MFEQIGCMVFGVLFLGGKDEEVKPFSGTLYALVCFLSCCDWIEWMVVCSVYKNNSLCFFFCKCK